MKFSLPVVVAAILAATGCAVGPRYQRPSTAAPTGWKTPAPWQQAEPKDALAKGVWWEVFEDPDLNRYEKQLVANNQSLIAASARLEQARALMTIARAGLFPQISAAIDATRQRLSGNRAPVVSAATTTVVSQTAISAPLTVSYEADLFGRIRNSVASSRANFQASATDLQNVQLVLASELAADYFTLRELDAELVVVQESVNYQRKGLDLVENRHRGGIASGLDVAQQASLLDATMTQLSLVRQQRDQLEHAIAALVGIPASSFSIPQNPQCGAPPAVPLGLPSDLLERRPDIAMAERLMAARNAQVGIAQAAYYPLINLTASGGVLSRNLTTIANAPSLIWAVGGEALQPIFQGGRLRGNLQLARASYDESVANYRQSVLSAFQQVEDELSALNALSQALQSQNAAVSEARRQLEIATNRYNTGVTSYLDVITAQSTLLTNERLATQLVGQQMVATVSLIKALGGGWDAASRTPPHS